MITTGLGAGSYPEAPDIEENTQVCENCGYDKKLKEYEGIILCRSCRMEKFFEDATEEDFDKYISSDPEIEQDFYLNWFLDGMTKQEKLDVAKKAFQNWDSKQKTEIKKTFVEKFKCEFYEFMEE